MNINLWVAAALLSELLSSETKSTTRFENSSTLFWDVQQVIFSTYVYQEQCSAGSFRLAPVSPEHGMKWMSFLGLKPTFFKNGTSFSLHSSYLWRNVHDVEKKIEDKDRISQLWYRKADPGPLQAPAHSGVVHFVHEDDQVFDSRRFGQHGVLSRLASFFKPRLKLAFTCWNHLRDISETSLKCPRRSKTSAQDLMGQFSVQIAY